MTTQMRTASQFRMWFILAGLLTTISVSSGHACTSVLAGGSAKFKDNFSKRYPAALAFVDHPNIFAKSLRLDVEHSTDFHPLRRDQCRSIARQRLSDDRFYGYAWFVLNNAVATNEGDELSGRSFVVIKAEAIYSAGATWISTSRNTGAKNIWQRDGRGLGGMRPRVLRNIGPKNWNEAHRLDSIQRNDQSLKVPLHATPLDGEDSTWNARGDLILDESSSPRKISFIFVSFLLADLKEGGSGIPFQILLGDVSQLMELRLQFISEVPDLNFATSLVLQ